MVISSIHQPRSNIFSMFSSLLLLNGGRPAYFGAAGDVIEYMSKSARLELPPLTNPADWLIDVIDAESGCQKQPRAGPDGEYCGSLVELWAQRQMAVAAQPEVLVSVVEPGLSGTRAEAPPRWQTSALWQFRVLVARSSRQQRGDVFNTVNVFQILAVAVIAACLWSGSTQVQDVVGVLFFVNVRAA